MKRIKIMLLSFALLAVVGGALAFKAKFQTSYCYTTTTVATTFCAPTATNFSTSTNVVADGRIYYTTPAVDLIIDDVPVKKCYTWIDPLQTANGTTGIGCTTQVRLKTDL